MKRKKVGNSLDEVPATMLPQTHMPNNSGDCLQFSFFKDSPAPSILRPITRPIHYLGSKLRLLNRICDVLDRVDPSLGTVCDLFAGSGTVSRAFSLKRVVIAVDIQEYSRVICSALLHPAQSNSCTVEEFLSGLSSSDHSRLLFWAFEPLEKFEQQCFNAAITGDLEPLCDLLENGSLRAFELDACHPKSPSLIAALKEAHSRLCETQLANTPGSLVSHYFGGTYFAYSQACHLDVLLEGVAGLPSKQRDTFLAAALSTASEIVNTIGKQFAQPIRPRRSDGRPKADLFELASRDRSVKVIDIYESWLRRYLMIPRTGKPHLVIREDYREVLNRLKGKVSVVYADPPYTRDHYSRYYHVLETMCLRDNPAVSTVRLHNEDCLSRGMYRDHRHQSPFCIHSKAPQAFASLFTGVRSLNVPLVLSYSPYEESNGSRPRLMTITQVEALAKSYFRHVEVCQPERIAHSKLTNSDKIVITSHEAEVLFVCEP
jgi:adenine-specific DNA methylase